MKTVENPHSLTTTKHQEQMPTNTDIRHTMKAQWRGVHNTKFTTETPQNAKPPLHMHIKMYT